jgi:formate hydrogenlyase subunit 3/multisubunit Na+/H+ antiporter MnhD subunit
MAPSGISAMLSGVVIEAGLVAMLKSLGALADVTAWWGIILMVVGVLNMIIGNLMALRQKQVKRLLAYSSLTHVGYMLVGLGVAVRLGILNGAQGGVFHLFNHGVMKGLAFLAAGCLLYTLYIASGHHKQLMIADLNGAAKRYPLVALTFSLAILGLGGIPPLSGFMSKWQIFVSGFESQDIWVELLVLFAAINSVFSLAYYAPLINALYRLEPSEAVVKGRTLPGMMKVPLVVLAVLVIVIGLWPGLINWLTLPAGTALVNMF